MSEQPAPEKAPAPQRIVEGVWLIWPDDYPAPVWLWQWTDAPDGMEYEVTWCGGKGPHEGHIEYFRFRAEAMAFLGMLPTD